MGSVGHLKQIFLWIASPNSTIWDGRGCPPIKGKCNKILAFHFYLVVPFFFALIVQIVRISLIVFLVILLMDTKFGDDDIPLYNGLIPYIIFKFGLLNKKLVTCYFSENLIFFISLEEWSLWIFLLFQSLILSLYKIES